MRFVKNAIFFRGSYDATPPFSPDILMFLISQIPPKCLLLLLFSKWLILQLRYLHSKNPLSFNSEFLFFAALTSLIHRKHLRTKNWVIEAFKFCAGVCLWIEFIVRHHRSYYKIPFSIASRVLAQRKEKKKNAVPGKSKKTGKKEDFLMKFL